MKRQDGFTVIELVVFIAILITLGTFFVIQKGNLDASNRDYDRKTSINAMYYGLTEAYYKENSYYPSSIDDETLAMIDPDLFFDPNGLDMNEQGSDYHYEGLDCDNDGKCQKFKLSSDMEREAEYTRNS